MPRFFLPEQDINESCIVLTGKNMSHAKVLRLKLGNEVTICDGQGQDFFCTISGINADEVRLQVNSIASTHAEPKVRASIFMAYSKSDKLEHVIQKAVELGAYEIVAFPCAFCVSRPDEKSLAKKNVRWQSIAQSAAEQSRRGRIPQVRTLSSFSEAIAMAAATDLSVLLYENEKNVSFRSQLANSAPASIAIMSGPEGGFEQSEVAAAQQAGMRVCTLGPRILRCETAPLCALSSLMFALGELD